MGGHNTVSNHSNQGTYAAIPGLFAPPPYSPARGSGILLFQVSYRRVRANDESYRSSGLAVSAAFHCSGRQRNLPMRRPSAPHSRRDYRRAKRRSLPQLAAHHAGAEEGARRNRALRGLRPHRAAVRRRLQQLQAGAEPLPRHRDELRRPHLARGTARAI